MIPCKAQAAGVTVLVGTAVGIPLGLLLTLRIPLVPLLGVEPVRKFAAGEDDHNHNITSMTNNNKNSNVLKGFRAVDGQNYACSLSHAGWDIRNVSTESKSGLSNGRAP